MANGPQFRISYRIDDPLHPKGHRWITIGAAWPSKKPDGGYFIKMDSLPFNFNGKLAMFPVEESQQPVRGMRSEPPPVSDEDIPF